MFTSRNRALSLAVLHKCAIDRQAYHPFPAFQFTTPSDLHYEKYAPLWDHIFLSPHYVCLLRMTCKYFNNIFFTRPFPQLPYDVVFKDAIINDCSRCIKELKPKYQSATLPMFRFACMIGSKYFMLLAPLSGITTDDVSKCALYLSGHKNSVGMYEQFVSHYRVENIDVLKIILKKPTRKILKGCAKMVRYNDDEYYACLFKYLCLFRMEDELQDRWSRVDADYLLTQIKSQLDVTPQLVFDFPVNTTSDLLTGWTPPFVCNLLSNTMSRLHKSDHTEFAINFIITYGCLGDTKKKSPVYGHHLIAIPKGESTKCVST